MLRIRTLISLLCLIWLALGKTLPSSYSLAKRVETVLGHRRMAEAQAMVYMQTNRLSWQPGYGRQGGEQLGPGVYITPGYGEYTLNQNPADWSCIIMIDQARLARLPKIWIPEEDEDCNQLWFNDRNIRRYIQGKGLNPDRTLRLSVIYDQFPKAYQILIPSALVNSLQATTWCYRPEDSHQVPRQRADIDNWPRVRDEEYKNESPNAIEEGLI
ncbi:hypothetical protein CC78DRAFT_611742 [Lojkania enalia]|uniref:Uncharacterized protein n=1 Tax=Lojkania enalia TaxID=147567 RepID=A0A9P4NBN5_9PLEO|nr:hypothetical protein CC78DRAFT_611742 [Didymosphaeria enalia]